MPFLFGPVVPVELVTTARRRRHYVVRVLYALVFLLVLWTHYQSYAHFADESMSINEMAMFAHSFFLAFSFTQLTAVLLLTPAYVAPSLADEKERRTLEYLFTTDLRKREIVLGKLAVRLGLVFLYILSGVPILAISSWFGGISFELLFQMYVLTVMTAVAVACGSMLASVYSRRVRDAVVLTYVAGLVWLVIPLLLQLLLWGLRRPLGPQIASWLDYMLDKMLLTNPYVTWDRSLAMGGGGWDMLGYAVLGLGAFAASCLVVSVLRVRQVYLKQTHGKQKRSGRASRQRRASLAARALETMGLTTFSRAVEKLRFFPIGERPMVWKELCAAESVRGGRISAALIGLLGAGLLAWCGWYVVQELTQPWSASSYRHLREEMNILLRVAGTAVGMLGLLAVSVRGAASVTSERERQTWDGLVCTPMEPRQIVLGKLAGAMWTARWLLALLVTCWVMGVLAGALHPAAIVAMTLELGIYAFFLASLGLRCSLGMKRTGGALATVLGIGVFLGGGYLMCCAPVAMGLDNDTGPFILGASFPVVVGMSGVAPGELQHIGTRGNDEMVSLVVGAVVMLAVYFGAGVALVTACISDFDRLSGRTRGVQRPRPTANEVATEEGKHG